MVLDHVSSVLTVLGIFPAIASVEGYAVDSVHGAPPKPLAYN